MERMTRHTDLDHFEHTLTNGVTAEKGKTACIDTTTGLITNAGTSATLIAIGQYTENLEGDGSQKVRVRLFKPIRVHWFENDDGGTPVVAADLLQDCYLLDAETVTGDATGASVAGKVWFVSSTKGVGVEMKGF